MKLWLITLLPLKANMACHIFVYFTNAISHDLSWIWSLEIWHKISHSFTDLQHNSTIISKGERKTNENQGLEKGTHVFLLGFVPSGTQEHISLQSEVIAQPWATGQRGWITTQDDAQWMQVGWCRRRSQETVPDWLIYTEAHRARSFHDTLCVRSHPMKVKWSRKKTKQKTTKSYRIPQNLSNVCEFVKDNNNNNSVSLS